MSRPHPPLPPLPCICTLSCSAGCTRAPTTMCSTCAPTAACSSPRSTCRRRPRVRRRRLCSRRCSRSSRITAASAGCPWHALTAVCHCSAAAAPARSSHPAAPAPDPAPTPPSACRRGRRARDGRRGGGPRRVQLPPVRDGAVRGARGASVCVQVPCVGAGGDEYPLQPGPQVGAAAAVDWGNWRGASVQCADGVWQAGSGRGATGRRAGRQAAALAWVRHERPLR